MRRYLVTIIFTGATQEVGVAPTNSGAYTVDTLLRQLPQPEYAAPAGSAGTGGASTVGRGPPFRIDIITTGSQAYGPPRGLSQEDDLPSPDDTEAQLYLLFTPRFLDRFPPPRIEGTEALRAHHARQVTAWRLVLAPLAQHLDRTLDEHRRAAECVASLRAEYERLVDLAPAAVEELSRTYLLDDSRATLASRIGDIRPLLEHTHVLEASRVGLASVEPRLMHLGEQMQRIASAGTPAAAEPTQANYDAMRTAIASQISWLKDGLRRTVDLGKEVASHLQSAKAVRDGPLLKLGMVHALPATYAAAIAVAKRRLTFSRAVARLHQMLSVEHSALCEQIQAFVAEHGPKFPTNIIPSIHKKPAMPVYNDPVAEFIRHSVVDIDEDPASELLVQLGLLRPVESSTTADKALQLELRSAKDAINRLEARLETEKQTAEMATVKCKEAAAEQSRQRVELVMVQEAMERLRQECDAEARRADSLAVELADTDAMANTLAANAGTVDQLRQTVQELQETVQRLSDERAALVDEREALHGQNREYEKELNALQQQQEAAAATQSAATSPPPPFSPVVANPDSDQLRAQLASSQQALQEALEARRTVAAQSAASCRTQDTIHRELVEQLRDREEKLATLQAAYDALAVHPQQCLVRPTPTAALTGFDVTRPQNDDAGGSGVSPPPAQNEAMAALAKGDRLDFAPLRVQSTDPVTKTVDEAAYHQRVFDALCLAGRPLKFRLESKRSFAFKQFTTLVAERGGHRVRPERCKKLDPAMDTARAKGFVFGEVVAISSIEPNESIWAHVSFALDPPRSPVNPSE